MMLRTRIQGDPFRRLRVKAMCARILSLSKPSTPYRPRARGEGTYALYLLINAVKARAEGGDTSWLVLQQTWRHWLVLRRCRRLRCLHFLILFHRIYVGLMQKPRRFSRDDWISVGPKHKRYVPTIRCSAARNWRVEEKRERFGERTGQ